MTSTMTLQHLKSSAPQANHSFEFLAVSKLQPIDKILDVYSQGQRHFGENYVQEALEKQIQLAKYSDISWHLIGHIQKKKVNSIIGKFHLIHSIDSLELLEVIGRKSFEKGILQDILIQVNIAEEESKEGFKLTEVLSHWGQIQRTAGIRVCGLMTMPPLAENPEDSRPWFRKLKALKDELQNNCDLKVHPLKELSMGTSGDWAVAIEEGATIVRIGTILFGERPTKD